MFEEEPVTGVHVSGHRRCIRCDGPMPLYTAHRNKRCAPCRAELSRKRSEDFKALAREKLLALIAAMPERFGDRRVIDRTPVWKQRPSGRLIAMIRVRCVPTDAVCEREQMVSATEWAAGRCGVRCHSCARRLVEQDFTAGKRAVVMKKLDGELANIQRQAREDMYDLPWSEDKFAQLLVKEHPGGMVLEDIATYYGVSRQAMQQLEQKALRKLRAACELVGLDPEDFADDWRRQCSPHAREYGPHVAVGTIAKRGDLKLIPVPPQRARGAA